VKTATGLYLGLAALAISANASAALVGPAADYNVFIFGSGSFMSQDTDTMGNLAAGGNVGLQNYAVAQGVAGNSALNPNPARLVVGGALTAQNGGVGSNEDGAIYYGTVAPALTSFTANGGAFANQSLVNFASAASLYTSYSTQLGALTANGTVSLNSSSDLLSLTGTSTGLDVFTVTEAQLNSSKGIDISAPSSATVLINVTGSGTATFSDGTVTETGVTGAAVLYNFVSATSVQLSPTGSGGKDPEGSILAPEAAVTGGFGAMSGQLIAASYSGNTQFDQVTFDGDLPAPVPLPGAALLLGSGVLGLLAGRRRVRSSV
jgi:choice-of-anchor A domain-containing protein